MTGRFWWLLLGLITLVLAYLLLSTLVPFVMSALLAYLGNPVVEKLESWRVPRSLGVTLMFAVFIGFVCLFFFVVLPPFERQLGTLFTQLPRELHHLRIYLQSIFGHHFLATQKLDFSSLTQLISQDIGNSNLTSLTMTSLSSSGVVLFEIVFDMVLVPVLTFYLMRDWNLLIARIRSLIPRSALDDVTEAARTVDTRLGGFLFGQLLVMMALAAFYMLALWVVGIHSALLIGLIAGFINFVPYLGFFVGIMLAGITMLAQAPTFGLAVAVLIVFIVGKLLEDVVLEPILVGDRVGLHPAGIIFAILAGGNLFGFWGVLLAVPAAAVIAGLAAYARNRWIRSDMYQRKQR